LTFQLTLTLGKEMSWEQLHQSVPGPKYGQDSQSFSRFYLVIEQEECWQAQ